LGDVDGHEFGNWYVEVDGLVQPSMLPDVSTASRKYGRDGSGHCEGSGDKHAAGS